MAKKIMTNSDFITRLLAFKNCKTLYCKGGIGQPLYKANQKRLIEQYAYNKNRRSMIESKDCNTFAADCCGLVKAVLWGWSGKTNSPYGGASYKSNEVPDVTEKGLIDLCADVSTDFTVIQPGEFVWLSGHCGVYIGDNLVVESTPAWTNGVLISGINGRAYEGRKRVWTKHGKLPWISYSGEVAPVQPEKPIEKNLDEKALEVYRGKYGNEPKRSQKLKAEGFTVEEIKTIQRKVNDLFKANTTVPKEEKKIIHTVKDGDNLTMLARMYGTTILAILKLNPNIINADKIYSGQKIRVK